MKTNPKYLLGAALCLLTTLTATQAAGHSGGGTGGTGGGTIYFIGPWANDTTASTSIMTTMNSDGSNRTRSGLGLFGIPSYNRHNGYRWFISSLVFTDQFYPDGKYRREIFAFRDDYDGQNNNNSTTRVQLTDDITLQPWSGDWVPGDNVISFIGRRWSSSDAGGTPVEGGIYTASLVFDAQGNITGLAAQPVTPIIPMPLVQSNPGEYQVGLVPDLAVYSWAPTADRVAYSNHADTGLWVADVFNGRVQLLSGQTHMPQWSPLGDLIAFTRGGICTIKPNGKGAKLVIPNTSQWWFSHAYWSPDGSSLAFLGASSLGEVPQNMDIFRAPASGGTPVNLTLTPSPYQEQLIEGDGGWRQ